MSFICFSDIIPLLIFDPGTTLGFSWTIMWFEDFDSRLEIKYDHHEGILCEAGIMTLDQRDNTNVI